MTSKSEKLLALLGGQPVIPVLKIKDAANAVPLARALAKGGLKMIEITLRTKDALEAIRPKQFDEAVAAGSKFIVSPGVTASLISAQAASEVPLLPGAITPGEIMTALEAGIDFLKFFPAEQAGGTTFLRSLASPLASARFCPTGGISALNAEEYLAVPNVVCVGGSWVAPDEMIRDGKWDVIESLARQASLLKPI
jgi:2-dehydro-3-deoxyphosphogluconate aldolase / (4S)-4-hydroxy-2-oxoglutarate aldolase